MRPNFIYILTSVLDSQDTKIARQELRVRVNEIKNVQKYSSAGSNLVRISLAGVVFCAATPAVRAGTAAVRVGTEAVRVITALYSEYQLSH